jgi:hypothetical protein
MNTIVTDLLGKRVTVSMWMTKGSARDADGDMVRLITGVVRAIGSGPDCFMVLVQTEIAHKGSRKVGALTMFSIGPRGGVEVVPESETMFKYRRLQEMLHAAQVRKDESLQKSHLDDMQALWPVLSKDEQDLILGVVG